MAEREHDDTRLMEKAAKGDLDAFGTLVEAHQDECWRVAFRFTGDAAEAEDLAQEAFLRILQAASRYEPSASFRTYLMRVLTRLCIDWKRKMRPLTTPMELPQPLDSRSPLDTAAEREKSEAVRNALGALPANQRIAIILRYFEGHGAAEIARSLETTPKAVERLLHRARGALERLLCEVE